MQLRKVALGCVGAAIVLACPGGASAQLDPGVHYDPGSPAGKEYAIPIVEGRADGAGTTDQRRGGAIPFGLGIVPAGRAAKKDGGSSEAGARSGGKGEAIAPLPEEGAEDLTARIQAAEAPASTAGRTLLLALAVVLPAGLLALLLRERPQASRTGRSA